MYCAIDVENKKLVSVHSDHKILADIAWLYTDKDIEISIFCIDNMNEIIELGNNVLSQILKSLNKTVHSTLYENAKACKEAFNHIDPPVVNPFILDMQIAHADKDRSKFYAWKPNSSKPNEYK